MMVQTVPGIEALRPRRFDVVCAGQPVWRASMTSAGGAGRAASPALLNVTKLLARAGLRVGLATVLEDDRLGRASLAELAALGAHVGAVKLAAATANLVVTDASGGRSGVVCDRVAGVDVEIPPSWSSGVLLLSGLTPVTSSLAVVCKAARKARRDGAAVVLDLVGSLRDWAGRDPRVVSMVLREADVVRCSFIDLAVIGAEAGGVRGAMRATATLVLDDDAGASARGAFGEVRVRAARDGRAREGGADACTAAICAELARPARPSGGNETEAGRWDRVLGRR
jgi:2-dehydro-3-deoxygluconokinase